MVLLGNWPGGLYVLQLLSRLLHIFLHFADLVLQPFFLVQQLTEPALVMLTLVLLQSLDFPLQLFDGPVLLSYFIQQLLLFCFCLVEQDGPFGECRLILLSQCLHFLLVCLHKDILVITDGFSELFGELGQLDPFGAELLL